MINMKVFTLKELLGKIEYIEFIGNSNVTIKNVVALSIGQVVSDNDILWTNDANSSLINNLNKGTIICSDRIDKKLFKETCNYIIVKNPRLTFSSIIKQFFYEDVEPKICKTAIIDPSVKLGENIFIGHHVIIEKKCILGNNCSIGHNSVVLANTIIGNNVKIGSNCTIGGVGFGYEKDSNNNYELIPHIGNVVLEDNVEIGNNTCIDKAVLGSTKIGSNVKIDNLVHIAHGVIIGRNSLVIANSLIGGSTIIGENVWISPSVSIINKVVVEDNAFVGMGAVVIKSVETKSVVVGNPAKKIIRKG